MQINRQSYEEYFLLYADGELNESEQKAVEEFIDQNPDLAGELTLIQETVFRPDGTIIFENKEALFKDESDERKVIYMRWFRIAAAAAILIALSVVGWVFLGDGNMHKEPVAIVKPAVKKAEPSEVIAVNEEKKQPVQQQPPAQTKESAENIPLIARTEKKDKENQHQPANHMNDIQPYNNTLINEPDVADAAPPAKSVEGAAFTQDVVKSEPGIETIDVTVEPRAMDNSSEEQPVNNFPYAQSFRQEPDDDMIYFANTSLTKKTKLRGVLRKATRYLDRVTSLQ
jgi:hypothetical protein